MNGIVIDEVLQFLPSISSKTMHAIQIMNHSDATHLIIIPLKITGVTNNFKVRKPTQEEQGDKYNLKIELTVEASSWDLSSPEFSRQVQSILDHRGQFVIPTTPARGQLFISSVTLHAYDAADVMDDDNYTTMLEYFVIFSSLQVEEVNK